MGDELLVESLPVPNAPDELEPQAHKVPSVFKAYDVLPLPVSLVAEKPVNSTGVV